MEDCLVFVDNGFFKLVRREIELKAGRKKKFLQTFRNICEKESLNLKHLFVYVAPPFQGRKPTEDEKIRKRKFDNVKKMLDGKKWATVREGRCQRIFDKNGEIVFNQKGVDSWIFADLCLFREDFPNVNKVILISSDSDFASVIKLIKEKKSIEVILYTYFDKKRRGKFYRSNHLLNVVSRWVKLSEDNFEDA